MVRGSIEGLIGLYVKQYAGEQTQNGEQLLQSFFDSLPAVWVACWPSSQRSKMEHGTSVVNRR
jgi:hypothetical protein